MTADVKRKSGDARAGDEGPGLDATFAALEQRVEKLVTSVREQAGENAKLRAALEEASAERGRLRAELADASAAAGSQVAATEKLARLEAEREALKGRVERLIGILEAPAVAPAGPPS